MADNRYPILLTQMLFGILLIMGMFLVSCSSTSPPQPEPSKQDIRQDADRFFQKMEQEEGSQSRSQ